MSPLVRNDATISQYVVTMRYDALASLPAGHSVRNSSMVRGLNEAANHVRASRRRGSRRISYRWRISLTSSKVAVAAVVFTFSQLQCSQSCRPSSMTGARARTGSTPPRATFDRSEEHTSELQSPDHLVC